MNRKILVLTIVVLILLGCESCDFKFTDIGDYYYANFSIRNDSSNDIKDIKIDTWNNWDGYDDEDKTTYGYDGLSVGEQSEYLEILTGFLRTVNVSVNFFIVIIEITYMFNGVENSVTVFNDGLAYAGGYGYEALTEEELEKVYLKKDTNNTLVITDDGVELLQGE